MLVLSYDSIKMAHFFTKMKDCDLHIPSSTVTFHQFILKCSLYGFISVPHACVCVNMISECVKSDIYEFPCDPKGAKEGTCTSQVDYVPTCPVCTRKSVLLTFCPSVTAQRQRKRDHRETTCPPQRDKMREN